MCERSWKQAAAAGVVAVVAALGLACSQDPLAEVRLLHAQREYLASLELLETYIESHPEDPEGHYLLGVACLNSRRASLGIWSLRRAREFEGWEIQAGLELARAGLASGDDRTAIEAATRVLEVDADNVAARALRAEAYARNSSYLDALADVEALIALSPNDAELELLRLRALIGLRRLDEAEEHFAVVEARRAEGELELPAGRYCLARALFAAESGEFDRAGSVFEACLDAHPTNSLVIDEALEFYDRSQKPDRSLEILRHALEVEPLGMKVRQQLAERLRAMDQADEAEALLLEGTTLEPDIVAAASWRALAGHHFELGDFAATADAWTRFFQLVPQADDESRLAYAEALALASEYDRALEVAESLPEGFAQLARGRVLLEQRQSEAAMESFRAGVRVWPDNAVARYYAARAAEHAGHFPRAISEYRHSLRADAGATDAGYRLARLHFAEGRYQPARIALSHHLEEHPEDVEARALEFHVALRLGAREIARRSVEQLARIPGQQGRALAEVANSLVANDDSHAAAASFLLQRAEAPEYASPTYADARRNLVWHLSELGRTDEALDWARRGVVSDADDATAHEVLGWALELSAAPDADVERAYRAALERDPDAVFALRGQARLAAGRGDVAAALELYDRAKEAASRLDLQVAMADEAIRLCRDRGQNDEARRRLEELVWLDPVDGQAASQLAELLLAEDPASAHAQALLRRGARFGGGAEALAEKQGVDAS